MMAGAHVRQRVSPHFSLSSGHLQIIQIMAATSDWVGLVLVRVDMLGSLVVGTVGREGRGGSRVTAVCWRECCLL